MGIALWIVLGIALGGLIDVICREEGICIFAAVIGLVGCGIAWLGHLYL